MKEPRPVQIYYDGTCPLCTVFADTVRQNPDYILTDATATTDLPVPKEQLLDEIHLYDTNGSLRTGADAVLTALSLRYSWLRPFSLLIRLPVAKDIARGVYFFISRRRTLWFGTITARLFWLYLLTIIGIGAGVLSSLPLWSTERLYPTISLFGIPSAFQGVTPILFILLGGALLFGLYTFRQQAITSRFLIGVLLTLLLLDVTRLQPWILHYLLLLGLFATWRMYDKGQTEQIIDAARIVIVAIYFWSGFQKLNTAFYLETFPWFTEPLWSPLGESGAYVMLAFGVFIPFVEMALALGLLTRSFRTLSLAASFSMLTLVSLALAFGHGWNSVVWSWNVIIFLMASILFYKTDFTVKTFLRRNLKNIYTLPIIIMCVIAPAGNIFGYTHHYLSWSLYSGHVPTATITTTPHTKQSLLSLEELHTTNDTFPFIDWSFTQVNVPPYPEPWYFQRAFAYVCQNYPEDDSLRLAITERSFFLSHQKTTSVFTCPD